MSMLWALIPLSFLLLSIAIWAFFWAVDHDQMEDLDQVSARILEFKSQETSEDEADTPNAPDTKTQASS